jgi:hypothetical protein
MNADLALQLLLLALNKASSIGATITNARAQNRDVSDAELDACRADDDEAKAELDEAIAKARK